MTADSFTQRGMPGAGWRSAARRASSPVWRSRGGSAICVSFVSHLVVVTRSSLSIQGVCVESACF
jgi:hypothetical protein